MYIYKQETATIKNNNNKHHHHPFPLWGTNSDSRYVQSIPIITKLVYAIRYSVVPINSSLLSITLNYLVRTTPVTKYAVHFMTLQQSLTVFYTAPLRTAGALITALL
jgi:hypothetical protein